MSRNDIHGRQRDRERPVRIPPPTRADQTGPATGAPDRQGPVTQSSADQERANSPADGAGRTGIEND